MKQYLSPEQTAKLIELGFEKPKSIIDVWAHETDIDMEYEHEYAYSIGELIEILPKAIGDNYLDILSPFGEDDNWFISYGRQVYDEWEGIYTFINKELIDALYDMVLRLKEEGVI
jgi:hypothetical protein